MFMKTLTTPATPRGWRTLATQYLQSVRNITSGSRAGLAPGQARVQALVREQLARTPVLLRVGSCAICEYEAPSYATITLDVAFLDQIEGLAKLVREHRLAEVRVRYSAEWKGDFRVEGVRLQVSDDDWCLDGVEKYVGYGIWTQPQGIEDTYVSAMQGFANGGWVNYECDAEVTA